MFCLFYRVWAPHFVSLYALVFLRMYAHNNIYRVVSVHDWIHFCANRLKQMNGNKMKLFLVFVVATTTVTATPIRLRAQDAAVIQEDRTAEHITAGGNIGVARYEDMIELHNQYKDHMVTSIKLFWSKVMAIAQIPFTEQQLAKANPKNAKDLGLENSIYHAFLVLGLTKSDKTQFIILERGMSLEYKKITKKWKPKPGTKLMLAVDKIPNPIPLRKMFGKLESYALASTSLRSGSETERCACSVAPSHTIHAVQK